MEKKQEITKMLFKIRLLSKRTLPEYAKIFDFSIFEYLSYENGNKRMDKKTLSYMCEQLKKEFKNDEQIFKIITEIELKNQ